MKKTIIILILILALAAFLRFYKISIYPPGLYIDEVSIGYNAYTILQKGVDQHGVKYPIWFKAFGEYKLPVYIYLTSLTMFVFGKSVFSVRFFSAFFGILTILFFYLFVKDLLKKEFKNESKSIALLSTFLLTISPWHLQLSRAGFEVNVALFFFVLGSWLCLVFYQQKKLRYLIFGYLSFVLTFYTYNSFRLITPLVLTFLSVYFYVKKFIKRKKLVIVYLLFFILSIPMLFFSLSTEGGRRLTQISAFNKEGINTPLQKALHYPLIYFNKYILHFSNNFLFNYGDGIKRHVMRDFGVLPRWQLPIIIIGAVFVFKNIKKTWSKVLVGLILIAPMASSLTDLSPHALRSYLLVIPFISLVSLGLYFIYKKFKGIKMWFILTIISLVALYEFVFHQHFYYVHYPQARVLDWGAGYKQTVDKTAELGKNYSKIYVSEKIGGEIYFQFYNDKLEVEFVEPGKNKPEDLKGTDILYVTGPVEKPSDKKLDEVYFPYKLNKDVFATFWEI